MNLDIRFGFSLLITRRLVRFPALPLPLERVRLLTRSSDTVFDQQDAHALRHRS